MKTLNITEAKAEKLDKLEDAAIDVVQKAIDGDSDMSDHVNLAMKALNVVSKNRQTSTHSRALEYGMVSAIATEKQRKKYIELTNPEIKKALTGKK